MNQIAPNASEYSDTGRSTTSPAGLGSGAVLALDLGTTAGWALRTPDDYTSSGTVLLKHSRYDGGGMRFLRFRRWLEDLDQDAGPIEAIYFEEVRRHVGTDAAHIYGGLLAVLSAWCEERLPGKLQGWMWKTPVLLVSGVEPCRMRRPAKTPSELTEPA